ncbi:hypothetical protein [Micromonospora echinofusca]|uniref:hypothetical protein n=1 Tax=Micromonospora echinofusca TaxID=47858 RepID=UPI003716E396
MVSCDQGHATFPPRLRYRVALNIASHTPPGVLDRARSRLAANGHILLRPWRFHPMHSSQRSFAVAEQLWRTWMIEEDDFFRTDGTRDHADLTIDTARRG